MKYNPGDALSFRINDHQFLSGLVLAGHGEHGKTYPIVLTGSIHNEKPSVEWFYACELFAVEYGVRDQSMFMLEAVLMEVDYVDRSADIALVIKLPFNGFVANGGFREIADISSLKDNFDNESALRKAPTLSVADTFSRKCFRSILDVLRDATPPDEFPTVKLYRTWDGDLYYWQLFSDPGDTYHLIINEGMLGGTGRASEVKALNKEEAREAYHELIRLKKLEGYQEADTLESMTLQFVTGDARGSGEDLDFRNEMWEYLDRALYWSGNGAFSGGDIGSGTINLFFEVVSPAVAVDTIVKALADKKVERKFFIIHEVPEEGGGVAANVIYPQEVKLTFHSKAR